MIVFYSSCDQLSIIIEKGLCFCNTVPCFIGYSASLFENTVPGIPL